MARLDHFGMPHLFCIWNVYVGGIEGKLSQYKYIVYVSGGIKGSTIKVKIEKISGTVAFGNIVNE